MCVSDGGFQPVRQGRSGRVHTDEGRPVGLLTVGADVQGGIGGSYTHHTHTHTYKYTYSQTLGKEKGAKKGGRQVKICRQYT